jgi:hypothetical protein
VPAPTAEGERSERTGRGEALFDAARRRQAIAAICRSLARLDAPASLWEDPPDTTIGDGAHADGRALLLRLSAWHLWLDRPDDAAEAASA